MVGDWDGNGVDDATAIRNFGGFRHWLLLVVRPRRLATQAFIPNYNSNQ